jgi:hypothetical protein
MYWAIVICLVLTAARADLPSLAMHDFVRHLGWVGIGHYGNRSLFVLPSKWCKGMIKGEYGTTIAD